MLEINVLYIYENNFVELEHTEFMFSEKNDWVANSWSSLYNYPENVECEDMTRWSTTSDKILQCWNRENQGHKCDRFQVNCPNKL